MPIKKREALYELFATGDKPTSDDFADLIDSAINIAEDGIGVGTGEPMEIVQQGEKKRFLDLSSATDTPVWRISAQSLDGARNGLNVASADNKSRLFIGKENKFVGINNDNPGATLHITPDSGDVLLVEDTSDNPLLIIDATGSIGMGTNTQESYKVSIGGEVNLKSGVTIDDLVQAENGITVSGAQLLAREGLSVENGAIIETGILQAKAGLTVTGKTLNANAGAIISGQALEVANGLTVNNGAVIETGTLKAKAGATVSGDSLNVSNGLTVNNGVVIETGNLEAKAGIIVSGDVLEANNGLTVQGETILNNETVIENGLLTVKGGLFVINGSTLLAEGPVALGHIDNGDIVLNGTLYANQGIVTEKSVEAKAGAIVSGSNLEANSGLIVQNGATVETGILTVQDGLSVANGSALSADGPVILGSIATGNDVSINGGLTATKGAVISGSELVVESGASITGDLAVSGNSTLGNATINTLQVDDITIGGSFGLESADLATLKADYAEIANLTTSGQLDIVGQCQTSDNVIFASGMIYASYEGPASVNPILKVAKGAITGETGHFDIAVDDTKSVTVIYDDDSEVDNFITDWQDYQAAEPEKSVGFSFIRLGTSSWEFQDQEFSFGATGIYQEYVLVENGLRIMYIAASTGTPRFIIEAKDTDTDGFEFTIDGELLTIQYPVSEDARTVNQLLSDWQTLLSDELDSAGNFEIRKTADSTGELLVTDVSSTDLGVNAAGNAFQKVMIKTNTVTINSLLKFDGSDVIINSISNSVTLEEDNDANLVTQKAVKTYVDNGLALKADAATVNEALALKADAATVNEALALKADAATVNEALALKADEATVTTELASKANQTDMLTGLASKADLLKPDTLTVEAGTTAAVTDLSLTTDSRGILMVRITADSTAKAGLFAIHGTDSLIKIAGDGMSDQQDSADSWNVCLISGLVTLQNASADDITAKVTYFGV